MDDGRTPDQRRCGKTWKRPVVEFGESVQSVITRDLVLYLYLHLHLHLYLHFFFFSFSFLFFSFFFFFFFSFFLFFFLSFFSFFFFLFSFLIEYRALPSNDINRARTQATMHCTSWRSDGSPSCLGGSSHRWVPVNTHSTPVPLRREAVGGSTTTTHDSDRQ